MNTIGPEIPAEGAPSLGAVGRILPDALLLLSPDGVVVEANPGAERILDRAAASLVGVCMVDLVEDSPEQRQRLRELLRRCAASGNFVPGALRLIPGSGTARSFTVDGAALGAADGGILLRLRSRESTTSRFRLLAEKIDQLGAEIRHRQRTEALHEDELEVLQAIGTAAPLATVLERLVLLVERHGSDGLLASILLLDEAGECLLHGAAPSLPREYNDAIHGLAIGPDVGACGSTAYRNREIVCDDIENDPRWSEFKELALRHGLRACWSTPIPSRAGRVLGTLALYYREPVEPSQTDRQIVAVASHIASIAIEQERETAEIKRLLQSERRARADAESGNRAKDEFLALISHELRNPLNAMLGWTRLLQMSEVDDDTRKMGIETIERNAELQGQLIADVLDFSRVSSGQLKLELQLAHVPNVVKEVMDSSLPDAELAGVALEYHAAPVEPTSCDPGRLHQVVSNLIGNAIKFTPAGGNVRVQVEQADGKIRLTVTDTGQGIDPAFVSNVFDAFRQADASLARPHSGLGLGLSVARRIVELHGGEISARSDGAGKGATFEVVLPVRPAPQPESEMEPVRDFNVTGLRVLVVDDEPDAREMLGAILRHHGAKPTLAASAAEAAAALDTAAIGPAAEFDVMISDIAMPDMDGYQLIMQVRRRNDVSASIPAAALTAHARYSDRTRAHSAGYDRHLAKPVDPADLLAVVSELAKTGSERR